MESWAIQVQAQILSVGTVVFRTECMHYACIQLDCLTLLVPLLVNEVQQHGGQWHIQDWFRVHKLSAKSL